MKKLFLLFVIFLVASCAPGAPTQLYRSPAVAQQPSITMQDSDILLNRRSGYGPEKPNEIDERPYITASDLPELEVKNNKVNTISEKHKIALLVPLTGESKELGKSLLDSAQLAVFDIGETNLVLLPYDTKSTVEGAKQAAEKAISENVDLFLGPLFSEDAKAVAPIAAKHDINVISFSNNEELIDYGVYLLGFMPEQQIDRVIRYALDNGTKDFSIIAPKNKFGEVAVTEIRSTLSSEFKKPKYVEYYSPLDESMSSIIDKFVKPIPKKDEKSPSKYEFKTSSQNYKTHAVLVPEGGRRASNIASRMFRHGMESENIRLLGTGQWDDPSMLKEKKLYGSWFASSSPKYWQIFEQHFKESYGYVPVRIASLAYDGIALAAYLASQNDFTKSAITNRRGYAGVNGVFRINSDGGSERALAVLEITENGFKIIDPAPEDFSVF